MLYAIGINWNDFSSNYYSILSQIGSNLLRIIGLLLLKDIFINYICCYGVVESFNIKEPIY